MDALARLARDWPFLSSLLDNAEMSLAKADMGVARLYAALATGPGDDRRWDAKPGRSSARPPARPTGRLVPTEQGELSPPITPTLIIARRHSRADDWRDPARVRAGT